MNNPNQNQLLSWLMANGLPSEPTFNHTFGHTEDTPFADWVEYTGDDEVSQGATGLTIDNVYERCAEGQVLFCTRTKELIRLTADPASADTTAAVDRCHGRGATTDYLKTGDHLLLLTPQMVEGFTTGKPQSGVDVYKSFTTGIVSYPVSATDTEVAERTYSGMTPFEKDLDKSWMRIKNQMESGLFFMGQKTDSSSYTQNYHTFSGIYDFVTTNVTNVSGTMSRMDFFDLLLEWRIFYKGQGAIVCSSYFISLVNQWTDDKVVMDQDAKELGLDIRRINLNGHIYDLIEGDKLSQDPYLMGMIFLVPKGKFMYRPLKEKKDLDIAYNPISRDEVHSDEGEIYGQFGYEYFEEETWSIIEGLEF